jgi:hypothetical protein
MTLADLRFAKFRWIIAANCSETSRALLYSLVFID